MMKKLSVFALSVFSCFVFSCSSGNTSDHTIPDATERKDTSVNATVKADSSVDDPKLKPEAPFHLSKEDSTRVADSVARKKDPIRDFE